MNKLAAALAVSVLALTGCSGEVSVGGDASIDRAELEREVSAQLEETVGQAPDLIECPGDLDAKEGTEMRCTLTAGEDELGVTVTVTAVDGGNVDFDIQVDEEMME
jgi:hypothetical protein